MDFIEIDKLKDVEDRRVDVVNDYSLRKRLVAYANALSKEKRLSSEFEIQLRSVKQSINECYNELYKMCKEDLREVEECYKIGAYKATMILAGSILEAFLIDWLSEKDGINYFEQPYRYTKVIKGTEKLVEDDRLCNYIDRIAEIEKPKWMEEKEKAHEIRKSRNLVHAKLCLKEDIDISQDTCKLLIDYLQEIIDSRLKVVGE